MGINIEQHAKEKKLLLSQYDKILKSEYLLKFDINIDDIFERVENLKNERFFISICGQMNSGKSTLLNSYIFGDLILPFDNTTQTAKLTIMEYSEKPYFEPVFYTEKEWDQVKKRFQS
jgi:septin family protein